jgi:hypothetical protein
MYRTGTTTSTTNGCHHQHHHHGGPPPVSMTTTQQQQYHHEIQAWRQGMPPWAEGKGRRWETTAGAWDADASRAPGTFFFSFFFDCTNYFFTDKSRPTTTTTDTTGNRLTAAGTRNAYMFLVHDNSFLFYSTNRLRVRPSPGSRRRYVSSPPVRF